MFSLVIVFQVFWLIGIFSFSSSLLTSVSILSSEAGLEIDWFNDSGAVFVAIVAGTILFVSVLLLLEFGFVNCTRPEYFHFHHHC